VTDSFDSEPWDVVVVGAGAAGLLAAAVAAERGRRTLLLEKNPHAGVKILMSGGTRCNLTQATDARGIIKAYGSSGRFLRYALGILDPDGLVALVEAEGVPTKIEPTGKVFPESDRASDILEALLRRLRRSGATLALNEPLLELHRCEGDAFKLITPQRRLHCQSVLIATGGRSYPGSGTTGDGYAWAAALGHTIVPQRPALTPLTTDVVWVRELKGITLPDVAVRLFRVDETNPKAKPIDERRGSLLFAHFGLSGPPALDISRYVSGDPQPRTLELRIDFLPDESLAAVQQRLKDDARRPGRRPAAALLPETLPRRLRSELLDMCGISADKPAAELKNADLEKLAQAIKGAAVPLSGTLGFKKAEVTAGGVSLEEVDPRTMQSKRVPGLFLAGEVLDLDGPIGGYNFQAAFSTGMLAGEHL
jgi:predicted Rossmann fold flavoprotein